MKHSLRSLLLLLAVTGTACGVFVSKDPELDAALTEAIVNIEKPLQEIQAPPLQVFYEVSHKPVINRDLDIKLEIRSRTELNNLAFALHGSEGVKLLDPQGTVQLGKLKAGVPYEETISVEPKSEGVHRVTLFLAMKTVNGVAIRRVDMPVAVGRFNIQVQ